MIKDPNNENETIAEEIPRLLIKSWYPWNAMSGMAYYVSLIYQVLKIRLPYLLRKYSVYFSVLDIF